MINSIYGPDGNRMAEFDFDPVSKVSTLLREYVWFEGKPIAVIEGGVVYYVRSDHIGKPVFATDAAGTKVWEATYLPFGGVHTSSGANINLRFPGQWFQSESGLHQNWMRDYDPTTGRYIQADSLGLVDGASVYGYARQNPNRYIDPRGEYYWVPVWGWRAWRAYRTTGTGVAVIGGIAAAVPSTPTRNGGEGGSAAGPAPHSKPDENDALAFATDPFGGGNYCERLKRAINILRANRAWRLTDLNFRSNSYSGHIRRIARIDSTLKRLEDNYRIICGGECPVE